MSKTIGVLNFKGGTGKTTTVVNLACGLALRGERVLCVDLDSQGNLATYFDVHPTCTLTHLMLDQATVQDCIVNVEENVDLISSDSSLLEVEGALWRLGNKQTARTVLPSKLAEIQEAYDYILLDYSPSASLLSESALLYTEDLLITVSMNYLSLVSTSKVIGLLKQLKRLPGSRLRRFFILPTFYYQRLRKDREIMENLNSYFADKVVTPIRSSVKLSEAASYHQSIYTYAPFSSGAKDYARLVEKVVGHEQTEKERIRA